MASNQTSIGVQVNERRSNVVESVVTYEELVDDNENDYIPSDTEVDKVVVELLLKRKLGVSQATSGSIPASEWCLECKTALKRADQFACSQCRIWPLCGGCILEFHLCHNKCYHVPTNFLKHISAFSEWWFVTGNGQHKVISNLENRITLSLTRFNNLASRYCSDEILSRVMRKVASEVKSYEKPFVDAMATYRHIRYIDDLMRRFVNFSKVMPPNTPIVPLVFFETSVRDLTALIVAFNLAAVQSKPEAEKAVTKLESLNRMLEDSLPPEDDSEEEMWIIVAGRGKVPSRCRLSDGSMTTRFEVEKTENS